MNVFEFIFRIGRLILGAIGAMILIIVFLIVMGVIVLF